MDHPNACADCAKPISDKAVRCVQCTGATSRGEDSPHWKGGRTRHEAGYIQVLVPGHPRAKKPVPYVYEHILVAEQTLGRFLLPGEVVHHVNGVKDDNRPENLMVFPSQSEHMRWHREHRTHCRSGRHEWTTENVHVRPNGSRECIPCRNETARLRYQRNRQT